MAKSASKLTLDPSRDIPLDRLELSQSNVRRVKAGQSIDALAGDIERRGLLQSLNVRPILDPEGQDTGRYEVPAGGRRFRALELLVKQKKLAKDAPIPCVVRAAATDILAEEDSLAENSFRENLHPLDEFRGMQAMVEKGNGVEAIAAHFHTTPGVVRQRLKLASVSERRGGAGAGLRDRGPRRRGLGRGGAFLSLPPHRGSPRRFAEAQRIAYDVTDVQTAFKDRYKTSALTGSHADLVAKAEERWKDSVGAFEDAMKVQAGIARNMGTSRQTITTLVTASQSATGALQAAQAGNELLALQSQQIADLTAAMAAQGRAAALDAARAATAEAEGRERFRRFRARD